MTLSSSTLQALGNLLNNCPLIPAPAPALQINDLPARTLGRRCRRRAMRMQSARAGLLLLANCQRVIAEAQLPAGLRMRCSGCAFACRT
jgi:hypothetical protein